MNDRIIAVIPQLDSIEAHFVNKDLPTAFLDVGTAVHGAPVTEEDGGLVGFLDVRDLAETVLQVHLHFH